MRTPGPGPRDVLGLPPPPRRSTPRDAPQHYAENVPWDHDAHARRADPRRGGAAMLHDNIWGSCRGAAARHDTAVEGGSWESRRDLRARLLHDARRERYRWPWWSGAAPPQGTEPGVPGSCGAPYGPGTLRTGVSAGASGGMPLHNRLSGTYRGAEPDGTRDTGCRAPRASGARAPKATGPTAEPTGPAATDAPDSGPRPPSGTTHHLPPAGRKTGITITRSHTPCGEPQTDGPYFWRPA